MNKTSIRSSALLTLALLCVLTILASCQTPSIATGVKSPDVCLIWQGITYSAKGDTAETVQGVRVNNAKRQEYCGAK